MTQLIPMYWKKCTTCKKPIDFGQNYWICSVSTCNHLRTQLIFCDVKCFDAHVPVMKHRDAGAFERRAPQKNEIISKKIRHEPNPKIDKLTQQLRVLVVVSKVKAFIRGQSGFNTSDAVMSVLTKKVIQMVDRAIGNAKSNGRKVILDRDFHS